MPGLDFYPPADAKSAWFADTYPGTAMGGVDKVLLHTTEGSGWPPYAGGSVAPNLTYFPMQRVWRQHFPLTRSSRSLCDPASTAVRENRDRVVQVEIVAVCDPDLVARTRGLLFVDRISDDALSDLGLFLAFMHRNFGVPLVAAPKWLPYPRSAGDSPVRMSGPQFDAFRGVLGHQHASGNSHGDPGSLDVPRIIHYANSVDLPPQPKVMIPGLTRSIRVPQRRIPQQEPNVYRYLRSPDGRYWGVAGLQMTHLETPELRQEYLRVTGLKDADVLDVTNDFLANLQRIT